MRVGRDDDGFDVQDLGELLKGFCAVADAEREMMGRSFRHPAFQKGADVRLKKTSRVRVPGRENRTADTLALRKDELESAVVPHADTQHRDRSFLNLELDAGAGARLAMVPA